MTNQNNTSWTDEKDAKLSVLWSENHSTAEIGRRMGLSKNAIIGRAHRLKLPPRPKAIKPAVNWTDETREDVKCYVEEGFNDYEIAEKMGITRGAVNALRRSQGYQKAPKPIVTIVPPPKVALPPKPVVRPVIVAPQRPAVPAKPIFRMGEPGRQCQWITTKDKPFLFCHAETELGRSYCEYHHRIAHPIQKAAA